MDCEAARGLVNRLPIIQQTASPVVNVVAAAAAALQQQQAMTYCVASGF